MVSSCPEGLAAVSFAWQLLRTLFALVAHQKQQQLAGYAGDQKAHERGRASLDRSQSKNEQDDLQKVKSQHGIPYRLVVPAGQEAQDSVEHKDNGKYAHHKWEIMGIEGQVKTVKHGVLFPPRTYPCSFSSAERF